MQLLGNNSGKDISQIAIFTILDIGKFVFKFCYHIGLDMVNYLLGIIPSDKVGHIQIKDRIVLKMTRERR